MSIATTVRTAGPFAGTGSLVALPFAFKVFTASDLVVQRTNVAGDVATLTLTTHYSVSLNADQDTAPGGTVTLVTALAVGETAALTSSVSATQPLQLASGGPFLPGQIEDALDRAMIVVQQQNVLGEQALRVPLGETALILPSADQRANKALLFDADGDPYLAAPASGSAADLALSIASTAAGDGAALVGFDWSLNYAANTIGWAIVSCGKTRIPALKYIPVSLWAGLAAGTETTDVGPYINLALVEAAATGGIVSLPMWTMCHSTMITWTSKGVALDGGVPKHGVTASSARGCCLKWTGATGATQVKIGYGGHNAWVHGIMFDANDKADTCLAFELTGGITPRSIHTPGAQNLRFNGYRGAAVVFGNPNTTSIDAAQMQQAYLRDCSWWGGGATATPADVFGLVLNAQNCEVLVCSNLFFDPYTSVGGGPNINHQSHIKVRAGGLNLTGVTFTRSTSYNVDVVGECGLVMTHVRAEDPLLLRTASGYPSNPIYVAHVEGRDGAAVGTEDFIYLQSGGGATILLENIKSTGNISVQGANDCDLRTRNITFTPTATAAGASVRVLGGTPYAGRYDIGTSAGDRTVRNSLSIETWRNENNALMYRNDRGRVRVSSLQGVAASADCRNFGGAFQVTATSATHTVTFATAEPDTNYRVLLSINAVTGTPAAGANRVLSVAKTTAGFTVTFEADAGAGNAVTFAWMLFRS